ncbi:NUDIX hydrolase domain-like protein [Lentinula lateritia]|uniref:NUDIX hydrolase domain-like protein n=1 Tax=Lentinula lateritia TaxID=40482 RepID=A0ABQ8VQ18_9AGAR|nr:NUDIX hydrolase domain-like protein [Lentinula lateritia]
MLTNDDGAIQGAEDAFTDCLNAVAILAILKSKANSFSPSSVVVEQYRPPIGKFIIELPAGLVDEGETPEQAAIRELEEETGYNTSSLAARPLHY